MPSMPANIRVASRFPFPALVVGAAPIAIAKSNGIWTVSLNVAGLAAQVPPIGNYPTDFVSVYDANAAIFFKMSLSTLVNAIGTIGARTQRFVNATPIVVASNDQIITCGINANATCALPAAATRLGAPLTFKDLGFAFAHNITFTPNGAETIDGAANFVMSSNRQAVTFNPFNDGVNTGWFIT